MFQGDKGGKDLISQMKNMGQSRMKTSGLNGARKGPLSN